MGFFLIYSQSNQLINLKPIHMKKLFLMLTMAAITLTSCNKKEIENLEAENKALAVKNSQLDARLTDLEANQNVKSFEFFATFGPGVSTVTQSTISQFNYTSGDVILVFYKEISNPARYYPLPLQLGQNVSLEYTYTQSTGFLYINLVNDAGALASITNTVIVDFKAVHLKASFIEANPNLDLNNYTEVMSFVNSQNKI